MLKIVARVFMNQDCLLRITSFSCDTVTVVWHHAPWIIADHESSWCIDGPSNECILKTSWPAIAFEIFAEGHFVASNKRWRWRKSHSDVKLLLVLQLLMPRKSSELWFSLNVLCTSDFKIHEGSIFLQLAQKYLRTSSKFRCTQREC